MIEFAIGPDDGVMASLAGGRESGCNVVDWCLGVVVVGLVTGRTCRARQFVIVVHVALDARCRCMCPRQRPSRAGVIEFAIGPKNCVVAALASGREAQRDVVDGCLRVVVVRLMARDASRIGDFVVAVHMTLDALHGCMEAR